MTEKRTSTAINCTSEFTYSLLLAFNLLSKHCLLFFVICLLFDTCLALFLCITFLFLLLCSFNFSINELLMFKMPWSHGRWSCPKQNLAHLGFLVLGSAVRRIYSIFICWVQFLEMPADRKSTNIGPMGSVGQQLHQTFKILHSINSA